jgi:hypothetical protein
MLKNSRLCGTASITGNAGPTEHQAVRCRGALRCGGNEDGQRPRQQHQDERQSRTLQRYAAELAWKDEQAEGEEHRDLRDPGKTLVEGRDRSPSGNRAGSQDQTGQVDGEESGAFEGVRGSEGDCGRGERCDGIEPTARQSGPPEALYGQVADREPRRCADRKLPGEGPEHVEHSIVRLLDPVDEPEHEENGDRVVHAGLSFQGACEGASQRGPAKDREDGGRVGGGEDRSQQKALEGGEVEEPGSGESRQHCS